MTYQITAQNKAGTYKTVPSNGATRGAAITNALRYLNGTQQATRVGPWKLVPETERQLGAEALLAEASLG